MSGFKRLLCAEAATELVLSRQLWDLLLRLHGSIFFKNAGDMIEVHAGGMEKMDKEVSDKETLLSRGSLALNSRY